jgi:hypothetical protein
MPWLGLSEFENAMTKVARDADLASKAIVAKSAAVVIKTAQANFEGARKWVSGSRGGRHMFPARHVGGDRPNVVSGDLRRSIKADPIIRFGLAHYATRVGPRVAYGRRVEFGLHGSPGYPFFNPAVEESRPELARIAADTWRQFLR